MEISKDTMDEMYNALDRLRLAIPDFEKEESVNIKDLRRMNIALEAFYIFSAFSTTAEIYDKCVERAMMIEDFYKTPQDESEQLR